MHGETGRAHISILAISSGGVTVAYHKMWLSGEEPRRFAQGNTPSVLDVDGWRVGLALSHDLIVPLHAAETAEFGLDAYLVGALVHADQAQEQAQRARQVAIEYGLWVAVANFAGAARGYPEAAGGSGIWGPYGDVVTQSGPEAGAVVRATLR